MRNVEELLRAITDAARPRVAGRTVLVFAHPDDETLACGALLPRLQDATLVHVTDGAPWDGNDAIRHGFASPAEYAAARAAELRAAVALAGISTERLVGFDVADQGAAFALADVARRLVPLLEDADLVITHAYEGGHPDHDAVCWAVHAALNLNDAGSSAETLSPRGRGQGEGEPTSPERSLRLTRPALVEVPLYRLGPDGGWLRQTFGEVGAVLRLTPAERELKGRMIAAHASQAETLAGFGVADECYRVAPSYDFGQAPNGGALLYEHYGWGLTGARWLELTADAARDLRLEQAA